MSPFHDTTIFSLFLLNFKQSFAIINQLTDDTKIVENHVCFYFEYKWQLHKKVSINSYFSILQIQNSTKPNKTQQ